MKQHEIYMKRCLELAALGLGYTAPNPVVGAVLVFDSRIIGEGWHQQYGEAHAEVNCLNSVNAADRDLISESTLYVSLEPCSHFGKTPPCTNLIIENKIPRVVIGCRDSFEKVNGSGIQRLKEHGVEVIEGVLEAECKFANRRFFTFYQQRRPYIILKWAESKEGFIASNEAKQIWLSGEDSVKRVHEWRKQEAAILVGFSTAKIDNPKLNNRSGEGNNPLRIVIDKNLELPQSLHLLNDELPAIIINSVKSEDSGNKKFVQIDFLKSVAAQILETLYQMDIQSVIIEGGAKTLNIFIDENLWDEARVFETQKSIADGKRVNKLKSKSESEEKIGDDILKIYLNNQ